MQPVISVIIPVYNKEQYLSRCLDSVTGQTIFNQLKVIIIDDGSTDNSFDIMQEYHKKHSNISIFKQVNAGVSSTRNRGIELALGKYIYFIDADDFMDSNMLEILYSKSEQENSEITVCNVNIYNAVTKNISKMKSLFEGNILFEKEESIKLLTDTSIGWSVWNKLYNLEYIRDNNILFEETVSAAEDFLFNFNAFLKVNKVVFIDKYLYYYVRMIENSLTRIPNPKLIEQGFFVWSAPMLRMSIYSMLFASLMLLSFVEMFADNSKSIIKNIMIVSFTALFLYRVFGITEYGTKEIVGGSENNINYTFNFKIFQ